MHAPQKRAALLALPIDSRVRMPVRCSESLAAGNKDNAVILEETAAVGNGMGAHCALASTRTALRPLSAPPLCGLSRPATASRRSEEHTSELQSLMRTSYAVF